MTRSEAVEANRKKANTPTPRTLPFSIALVLAGYIIVAVAGVIYLIFGVVLSW